MSDLAKVTSAVAVREAMSGDVASWGPETLHLNWGVIDRLHKAFGGRLELIKSRVKEVARKNGTPEASGSYVMKFPFGHIRAKIHSKVTFDVPALVAALQEADVPLELAGKVTYSINEAKCQELADRLGVPIGEIMDRQFSPDKAAVEKLVLAGKIPLALLESVCKVEESYTFDAKIDEEAVNQYVSGGMA